MDYFKNEYVVWGKKPNENEETLLISKLGDNYITSKEVANKILKRLEDKYGCYDCRVQEIDFSIEAMDEFVSDLRKTVTK